jgi:hypothetical protein
MKRAFLISMMATLLGASSLFGQDTLQLAVIARSLGDSVMVRWSPMDYKSWKHGIDVGYTIERRLVYTTRKNLPATEKRKVLATNLVPLPEAEWERMAESSNAAGVIGAALFGTDDGPQGEGLSAFLERKAMNDNKMAMALLAAEQYPMLAVKVGLGYIDKDIHQKDIYNYVIYPSNKRQGLVLDTVSVVVDVANREVLPAPTELISFFGDRVVRLRWSTFYADDFYTSYDIERSEDNGKTFKAVNEYPYIYFPHPEAENVPYIYYNDSLQENKKLYIYRVRGRTPFAEIGPPSNTTEGEGIFSPVPVLPRITRILEFPDGQFTLEWSFDKTYEDKIKGFYIYRKNTIDGKFERVNKLPVEKDANKFTDESPYPSGYYKMTVLDENDNEIPSAVVMAQLIDATPPAPPTGIEGIVDTSGMVLLHWKPNTELDLYGYRVYVSNAKDNPEYSQITSTIVKDTFYRYQVTMNTLSEEVYFKVVALDFRENYSGFSLPCTVKRPDLIPPDPPVFSEVTTSTKWVHLRWSPSSSKDVVAHRLERKREGTEAWDVLDVFKEQPMPLEYIDSIASPKYSHTYRIVAVDDADLQTPSEEVSRQIIDNGQRPSIMDFKATPDRVKKLVRLEWEYPKETEVSVFALYRATKDGALKLFKTIERNGLAPQEKGNLQGFLFEDKAVSMDTRYAYRIMAKHRDGGQSPLSPLLSVEY